jgi:6-pyruvoyltetrahydropterin/6-carboxytetrahydropterin synthase
LNKSATIELSKEYLKFSAGHFTIFSATERERLHGHNFSVSAKFRAPVGYDGLCFNYGDLKKKLAALCDALDEYLLLPGNSPYLKISEVGNNFLVEFNREQMQFLKSDALVIPVRNISVEELAGYLLDQLINDPDIEQIHINYIEVSVASGPGQCATRSWNPGKEDQNG